MRTLAAWIIGTVVVAGLSSQMPQTWGSTGYLHEGSLVAWGDSSFGLTTVPAGNTYTQIASGGWFDLALKSDGSIAGWGYNGCGETNVPTGSGFVQIAAGEHHGIALKADGHTVGWGLVGGPVGDTFTRIAAGGYESLGIMPDGSVANEYGPLYAGVKNFTQIARGSAFSLSLKSDGSLFAWGANSDGQTNVPTGTTFTQIGAGGAHGLAIKANGSLVGWGWNMFGQTNVPVGNNFIQVAAGYGHSLALKSDGTLMGWGLNNDSNTGVFLGQKDVPAGNSYLQVSAGYYSSLALKARTNYEDLLIQDVDRFTKNDTLLQNPATVSGNVNINGAVEWLVTKGHLNVAGGVNILPGSQLTVQLGNVTPTLGQKFDMFDSAVSATGRFSALNLPTLSQGLTWDSTHLYDEGILQVIPEPASLSLLIVGVGGLLVRRRRHS